MRTVQTQPRSAATLVEVLVAIFVMAIGLLALLALFPLGILRMQQAIQDGRTAQVGHNASEIALFKDVRHDPLFQAAFNTPPDPTMFPPDPEGPSYPVFVDAIGYHLLPPPAVNTSHWLANDVNTNIRRETASFAPNTDTAKRWFSLLDDLNYELDGRARLIDPFGVAVVERDINYTWSYLCQRPRSSDPSVVNLSVVVFRNRAFSVDPALNEHFYPANTSYNTTNNTVIIDYTGNVPPPLRAGSWILDCTPIYTQRDPATGQVAMVPPGQPHDYRTAHGNFYRVVGVDEIGPTQLEAEVETPIRGFPPDAITPGFALVMENVVEVFDKGTGWRP